MALNLGDRFGHYNVTALLGEGGMGRVYRATDTDLGREVALKILPDAFADDPDRLARFQREAQVLASLNHPGIAAIYGTEQADDTRALVLELVEGPTLADRIAEGPIPVDEALPIATQIAEAHEVGVIHRDLKPANIKVRDDGTVKVLDFGLAKALDAAPQGDPSQSPTLTAAATQMGVIMGTAAYMAPEQAKGRPVDKRVDIWAFGAVVFEMLTGNRLFDAGDASETLASILVKEPDVSSLGKPVPEHVRAAIRRCLVKDPRERLRDIGDVRLLIAGTDGGSVAEHEAPAISEPLRTWQRPGPAVLGALLLVATGFLVRGVWFPSEPSLTRVVRFTVGAAGTAPVARSITHRDLALSSDGSTVVYLAGATVPSSVLTVQPLSQLTGAPLVVGGEQLIFNPFISPDGDWVGFYNANSRSLQRLPILGGPVLTTTSIGADLLGADWGPTGDVVFGSGTLSGLWRVAATGGPPEEITHVDSEVGETNHGWPEVLPDGNHVLFTVLTDNLNAAQIAVANVATGAHTVLLRGGHGPRYVETGHIVYGAAGALRAVTFSLDALEVTSTPVPVLEDVTTKPSGAVNFDVSRDGSLVYTTGGSGFTDYTPVWVTREGLEESLGLPSAVYRWVQLAPDGRSVALDAFDTDGRGMDVWIGNLERGTLSRITNRRGVDNVPIWTPDGEAVVFASERGGDNLGFYRRAADGTGPVEHLLTSDTLGNFMPYGWTPDGETLVFDYGESGGRSDSIGLLSLGDGSWRPLFAEPPVERQPALSPDGRWIAYTSERSGQSEVYVERFPDLGGRQQISTAGGDSPLWSPDGRELYFRQDDALMAVSMQLGPPLVVGPPELLFRGDYSTGFRSYDVAPDGTRFVFLKANEVAEQASIAVVLDWDEELKRLVPVE